VPRQDLVREVDAGGAVVIAAHRDSGRYLIDRSRPLSTHATEARSSSSTSGGIEESLAEQAIEEGVLAWLP
jgi:hypothetical protein